MHIHIYRNLHIDAIKISCSVLTKSEETAKWHLFSKEKGDNNTSKD